MKNLLLVNKLIVFMLCYWSRIPGVSCLRNVEVKMPTGVEKNHEVKLLCKYDLEGETLYTLKWYKNEQEFYRFTPKESPPIKIFKVKGYPDLEVVRESSNGEQVTLRRALRSISGRYTCEVTTDSPSFHAVSAHGELRVVVLPKNNEVPILRNENKIKEGEWINVTCISNSSIPAANLTWFINDNPVNHSHHISNSRRVLDASDQEESFSRLSFKAHESYFLDDGKLRVKCTASIYTIYQKSTTSVIILDRDRLSKWLYKPETQKSPTKVTEDNNVKQSRSYSGNLYNDNNDNLIEAGNLEHSNNSEAVTGTLWCILALLTLLLH